MPGPVYDKKNMMRALKWIRNMSQDPHCKGIYCAHDPEIQEGVITMS
ncbi:MAG: hypothetical protein VZR02_05305 [Lachnospiraceae bacterium]|nr:hypothetical protein [Lachnospiraceae bacterium]